MSGAGGAGASVPPDASRAVVPEQNAAAEKLQKLIEQQDKHPLESATELSNTGTPREPLPPISNTTSLDPQAKAKSKSPQPVSTPSNSNSSKVVDSPKKDTAKKKKGSPAVGSTALVIAGAPGTVADADDDVEKILNPKVATPTFSSMSLWNRLSLGRKSASQIAKDKVDTATKMQALYHGMKGRRKSTALVLVKAEEEAKVVRARSFCMISICAQY